MEGEITPTASYNSVTGTPTGSCCSFDDGGGSTAGSAGGISRDLFEMQRHRILRELQQVVNRYNECFLRLQQATADVKLLRQENLHLNAENLELSFLIEEREAAAAVEAEMNFSSAVAASVRASGVRSADPVSAEEKKAGIGEKAKVDPAPAGSSEAKVKTAAAPLGGLPKSISIRSPGFLSVKPPPSGVSEERRSHRLRLPASTVLQGEESGSGKGEVEVEVYSQGTLKTELCNKWGENGWCPYGDRCQFAHGIQELRPVIRHPRYKTQLCRMLGAGSDCPYGHRCHFRHAALPDPHAP